MKKQTPEKKEKKKRNNLHLEWSEGEYIFYFWVNYSFKVCMNIVGKEAAYRVLL